MDAELAAAFAADAEKEVNTGKARWVDINGLDLSKVVLTPRFARCTLRVVAQLAGEEVASVRDDKDEVED